MSGAPSFWRDSFTPHLSGAVVGGVAAGLLTASAGALLRVTVPFDVLVTTLAFVVATYAVAEITPWTLWRPNSNRQVSSGFRRTQYYRTVAALWGAELGSGWSTIQPTSAFLTMTMGALAGTPLVAIAAGGLFGAVRAGTIMVGYTSPSRTAVDARFGRIYRKRRIAHVGSAVSGLLVACGLLSLL